MMLLLSAASTGRACARSPASPPTMIANVPATAPPTPPETGASRNRMPRSLSWAAIRCEVPGSIVDMSTQSRLGITFDNPTGPQIGGLDIRRRRQHRNHQLAGCRGLCGRACPFGAKPDRGFQRRCSRVIGDCLKPLLDEIGQHWLAHCPRSDKPDLHTLLQTKRNNSKRILGNLATPAL